MFYEYNDSWDKLKRNRNQQNKNSSTDYTLKKYLIEATNMHSGTQKQPCSKFTGEHPFQQSCFAIYLEDMLEIYQSLHMTVL